MGIMQDFSGAPGTRRNRSSQSGISMPELVVALCVVLILAAIARPAMSAYLGNVKHKGAVTAVKRTLQAARAKALANPMVHCGVYFDTDSDPARLVPFLDTHSPSGHAYDPGRDKSFQAPYAVPDGVEIAVPDPNPASIIFRGDGSAWVSGKLLVRSGRFTDTVDVLASTGRIRVAR